MTGDAPLARAAAGDAAAWRSIVAGNEGRLARMIRARLDPRLRRRVDETDVLQETFL